MSSDTIEDQDDELSNLSWREVDKTNFFLKYDSLKICDQRGDYNEATQYKCNYTKYRQIDDNVKENSSGH